jgi:hypothetical protein
VTDPAGREHDYAIVATRQEAERYVRLAKKDIKRDGRWTKVRIVALQKTTRVKSNPPRRQNHHLKVGDRVQYAEAGLRHAPAGRGMESHRYAASLRGTVVATDGRYYDVRWDGYSRATRVKDGDVTAARGNSTSRSNPHGGQMTLPFRANPRFPRATEIQTLLFDRRAFTASTAKAWAKQHRFKFGKVDTTDNFHRLRQNDPATFAKGMFRTIDLTTGVKAVIGVPKRGTASLHHHQHDVIGPRRRRR